MSKMFSKAFVFFALLAPGLCCFPSLSMSQGAEVWSNLGLYGGQIYDIAIDPTNPDKIFAGSDYGDGLFLTEDGGKSWQAVLTGHEGGELDREATFRNTAVWAVKIAPTDNNVIWVAHNCWVEKSTDGGKTWTHIENSTMQRDCPNCGGEGDDSRFCRSLAIDPTNPDIVYVGTGGPDNAEVPGAIYKTGDGGESWAKMKINPGPYSDVVCAVVDLATDPNNPDILWAITDAFGAHPTYTWFGSLYRSDDGGETWDWKISVDTNWYDLEIKPDEPNIIFVSTWFGILRLVFDASGNLQSTTTPLGWEFGLNVRAMAFDPQDPNVFYTAWQVTKLSRSTDGGEGFSEHFEAGYQFLTLAVHSTNSEVLFGGELNLGIFRSQDHGQTWTPINDGINAVIVYGVAIDPNDRSHILAATGAGVYEKRGNGDWNLTSKGFFKYTAAFSVAFDPMDTDGSTYYAGTEDNLAMTTDSGATWSLSDDLLYNFVGNIAIGPGGTTIFITTRLVYGSGGGVYKSTDGGATLTEVLSSDQFRFNVVTIDPSDPNHIFAGGGNFYAPKVVGDLWESTDGGVTWTRTGLQNVIVNALLIDPKNSDVMYAGCGYSGGMGDQEEAPLYKSTDGGVTWIKSYEGIPGYPTPWNAVTDLEFHRENTNVVYASTNAAGVYISPKQAGNWLNIGTPQYDVYAVATSSLYAATQGGMLQCTGTGVIAGQVTDAVSESGIDGATVYSDMGLKTISVNGEYMMVSPSGVCDVTAISDDYANKTVVNATVYGGDVCWVDFAMKSGVSEPLAAGDGVAGGRGGGCFIAAGASESGTAKPVEILGIFMAACIFVGYIGVLRGFEFRCKKT